MLAKRIISSVPSFQVASTEPKLLYFTFIKSGASFLTDIAFVVKSKSTGVSLFIPFFNSKKSPSSTLFLSLDGTAIQKSPFSAL